jgi:hypothetical protein
MMPVSTFVTDDPVVPFTGKVVRIEADGFGIIQFDAPIGPSANAFGIVTSSTTTISPLASLRPGVRVEGTAAADERDAASIKTFQIVSPSA